MSVQPGASDRVYAKKEVTYGTSPGGNFVTLPFFNCGLGSSQPLITPTVIGASANRDPAIPIRDVVTVDGPVEVPIDVNNIGYWLNMMFGAPVTSGASDYTHTFKSGASTLASYTIEHAMPQVPNFALITGAMAGGINLNFQPSGEARASLQMVGQAQTNAASTGAGTPTTAAYVPAGQFQGTIKRNGSALGYGASATLEFTNNLEPIRTIRSDGKVDGFIPGITGASGDITVFLTDTTLLTQATGGTGCSIELAYTVSATQSLVITMGDVYLPVPKLVTPGPQGIRATFAYQAAYKAADLTMLAAVLKNQIAAY